MDFKEALLFAIQNEKKAAGMYLSMARTASNYDLKTVFQFLAAEEAKHDERLEKIYTDLFEEETPKHENFYSGSYFKEEE